MDDGEHPMNDLEQLYFAQAVFKSVADAVSTKDPDSLRSRCDAQMLDAYERTGAKSFDARVNGEKVGTYSVSVSKAKPASTEESLEVIDSASLRKWADENPDEFREWTDAHLADFAQYCFSQYGEVPDGCRVRHVMHDAEPARPKGTRLVIDPRKVAQAMGPALPDTMKGLLGGA